MYFVLTEMKMRVYTGTHSFLISLAHFYIRVHKHKHKRAHSVRHESVCQFIYTYNLFVNAFHFFIFGSCMGKKSLESEKRNERIERIERIERNDEIDKMMENME